MHAQIANWRIETGVGAGVFRTPVEALYWSVAALQFRNSSSEGPNWSWSARNGTARLDSPV